MLRVCLCRFAICYSPLMSFARYTLRELTVDSAVDDCVSRFRRALPDGFWHVSEGHSLRRAFGPPSFGSFACLHRRIGLRLRKFTAFDLVLFFSRIVCCCCSTGPFAGIQAFTPCRPGAKSLVLSILFVFFICVSSRRACLCPLASPAVIRPEKQSKLIELGVGIVDACFCLFR